MYTELHQNFHGFCFSRSHIGLHKNLDEKQRIYKVIEDADGRCRRFVIPKKVPSITDANLDPGQFATVKSFTKVVTLSLLNSPNTFPLSTPVERRFQDACTFLRNNREFIADEVVGGAVTTAKAYDPYAGKNGGKIRDIDNQIAQLEEQRFNIGQFISKEQEEGINNTILALYSQRDKLQKA